LSPPSLVLLDPDPTALRNPIFTRRVEKCKVPCGSEDSRCGFSENDLWPIPMPDARRDRTLLRVGHIHRLSVAGAALLVTALISVAFATRTSGADQPDSAAQLVAPPHHVVQVVGAGGYRLTLHVSPNQAPSAVRVRVAITRWGRPLRAARVRLTVTMLDMQMAGLTRTLRQTSSGRWDSGAANLAFGMAGRWGLRLEVTPRHARRFTVGVVDRVSA
jgi:hypothetical protein